MAGGLAAVLASVVLAGVSNAGDVGAALVRTDHHVHVHSPEILAYLPAYCASPGRIGACDPAFVRPLTADDLLAAMDRGGVARAWIMSTGYLAESPMMVPPRADAAGLVHAANAFTVDLARRHPGRLVAFVGVNPATPTALAEIEAWKDDPAARGVKIHLTNSGVDLRDPTQVARLAAVFRAASDAGMAIMIHMRTRDPDYGARDVQVFLDQILPAAGSTPVIIAHSGGWGGLDAPTWSAMEAFATALEAHPGAYPDLHFDIAQTFDEETSPEDFRRLAGMMRRIGPERFVPGSDWPFSGELNAYFGRTLDGLPLTADQLDALRSREVPLR